MRTKSKLKLAAMGLLSIAVVGGCSPQADSDALTSADPPAVDVNPSSPPPSTTVPQSITLRVGSKAPDLDIAHWLSKGNYDEVTSFEKGKVYVVEFWATWCGPCIASMPHLAELQQKYSDGSLQLISISSEDLPTVQNFLEREVPQSDGQTYKELTSAYSLTVDPDRSTYVDYMQAAGQNGIPNAFIVGKTGLIEWIGHPMTMDNVIDAVLNDTWDLQAYQKLAATQERFNTLIESVSASMEKSEFDSALRQIDDFAEANKDVPIESDINAIKLDILLVSNRTEEAVATAKKLFDPTKLTIASLNEKAWQLHQIGQQQELPKSVFKVAADALEQAIADDPAKKYPDVKDTLAALQYDMGDLEAAIATQQSAYDEATGNMKQIIGKNLETYQSLKAKQTENAEPEPEAAIEPEAEGEPEAAVVEVE